MTQDCLRGLFARESDGLGILQERLHAGRHNSGLDRQQLDPHQGDANPRIDHDALVKDAVNNFNQTRTSHGFLYCHDFTLSLKWTSDAQGETLPFVCFIIGRDTQRRENEVALDVSIDWLV
jgi:hypothetical protein